jgi:prevent-host-death family protein
MKKGKKMLAEVTTCDYSQSVKTQEAMILRDGDDKTPTSVVQEIAELPGIGQAISVRAAKAHLSGLLEEVSHGREVVITSGGKPKARLVPMEAGAQRVPFTGTREHLKTMPKWRGGPTSEEIVREDRDGRDW